jgi:hypothetical protein
MSWNFGNIPNNIALNSKQSIRRKSDDSWFEAYIWVETITAWTNITIDNTNPTAPIISASWGWGWTQWHTIQDKWTSLIQRGTLNFVWDWVTATDDSNNSATVVTINKTGDMFKSNNLAWLTDLPTARNNIWLWNVDNTSDVNKPVSTATQTALDKKADKWKIANSWLTQATWKLLWRGSSWDWAIEEITLWAWLSLNWTTLNSNWWQNFTITMVAWQNISWSASAPKALYIWSDWKAYLTSSLVWKYIWITTENVSAWNNVDIITSWLWNINLTTWTKYYVSAWTNADTWTSKADMTTARLGLTSQVINNIIYCIGGNSWNTYYKTNEAYDPSTDTWTTKADMPTAREGLTSQAINNIIYCIGWYNWGVLKTNEAYDPSGNSWTSKADMTTARANLTSSAVNNIIYCIGGNNWNTYYKNNEAYDPSGNSWTSKADMTTARYGLASQVVNNIIYCIWWRNSGVLKTNEAYDPSGNSWTSKADMITARQNITSSSINNIIYCIGWYDWSNYLKKNEAYDPSGNSWTSKTDMPTARYGLTSQAINNIIYCIWGYDWNNALKKNEIYNPLWTPSWDLTTTPTTLTAWQTTTSSYILIAPNVL